jgi:chemotaxis protein CheD
MLDRTDRFPSLREGDIFLNPGEMHCGFAPARVWTILGSCVSVIVWHKRLQFGAMSHYLLPERSEQGAASYLLDPRYGVDSCKLMLAAMRRAGVHAEQCQSRVFGGSHMFIKGTQGGGSIGQRNADVARGFLAENHIKVISESLFGSGHRRVYFDLSSGRVWESEARGPQQRAVRKSGRFS